MGVALLSVGAREATVPERGLPMRQVPAGSQLAIDRERSLSRTPPGARQPYRKVARAARPPGGMAPYLSFLARVGKR